MQTGKMSITAAAYTITPSQHKKMNCASAFYFYHRIYCIKANGLQKFLYLYLLLVCIAGHAQNIFDPPLKRCPLKIINFEQGLINIAITGAITDQTGFTWFSTKTGLQRYNGYRLVTVNPVIDDDTIRINYPVFFLNGKNNSVLIGYKEGVLEFNATTNSFKKIVSLQKGTNLRYSLMPIRQGEEGIWCLAENQGIIIYNEKGGSSNRFPLFTTANADGIFRSIDLVQNNKIIAANDNFIFIRTSFESILQIDLRTSELKYLHYAGSKLCAVACNNLHLFIAARDSLLCIRISDGITLHSFPFSRIIKNTFNISTLELLGGNRLLVSADKRLFEFDTACNCKREITTINRERIVNTGDIPFIYQDKFSRIWILPLNEIIRIQNTEIPFDHIIYPGEKTNFIRSIFFDEDKNLLLAGCFNGGILLFDTTGKPLWQKPLATQKVKDILAIEKFNADKYLIVTLGNGLYFLNVVSKELKPVEINMPLCKELRIQENAYSNSLQKINDSTFFISTRANVFRCIFKNDNLFSATPLLDPRIVYGYPISGFIYTADKILWTGSETGELFRQSGSGLMQTFKIPGNYMVRCFAEDDHHNIWAGTEKGLFVYSAVGKLQKQITSESGLMNDFIYSIQPGDNGHSFYVSTNLGLSAVSADGTIRNYTRELGLQENEFNTQSSQRSPTGKLFFGGINGITAFYPGTLSDYKDSCIINITRIAVNDSLYNSFAGPWTGDTLQLEYNHNHIQLDIAATGLLNPSEYNYRYHLKSFDETWQYTHQPADIRYTLPPGHYLFEIDCSPILSSGITFHKRLLLIVHPPWWQTWWFRIFVFAAAVILIVALTLRYNRRKYFKRLKAMQSQNEIQVERERISKELHDNIGTQLTYISSNLDWILDAPAAVSAEKEKDRLLALNKIAKEVISDLRETIWAIKKESVHLDDLADRLKLYIRTQIALYPLMDFNVNENIHSNICFSPTDALNIFRICQEAIANILKHANATTMKLSIHSAGNKNNFSLIIEDNGKGFLPAEPVNEHYGLENMHSRAKEMGASLSVISSINQGTKVVLHLV
jgi:two-component sensor histidine kinase